MSAPRKTYRISCYHAANQMVAAELIEAATDEEAIAMIESGCAGTVVEIWQDRRLVARLEAERRQA